MTEHKDTPVSSPQWVKGDNLVLPFQLESSHLRGRIVRLGSVLDDVLVRHDYPEPVAKLLVELVTLGVLLADMLKYNGVFSLQTSSDGPVRMLVVDIDANGRLRAASGYDSERLTALLADVDDVSTEQLVGKGYIAFTVDQGPETERYQGMVALSEGNLVDCVRHYFDQSEQIATILKLAIGKIGDQIRSGAILLQQLPLETKSDKVTCQQIEEDWNRTGVLLGTCRDGELLDERLTVGELLFRLFNEEGVRVYDPKPVRFGCRCSRNRVENVFRSLAQDELRDMLEDGKLNVVCEFCRENYVFTEEDIARLSHEPEDL